MKITINEVDVDVARSLPSFAPHGIELGGFYPSNGRIEATAAPADVQVNVELIINVAEIIRSLGHVVAWPAAAVLVSRRVCDVIARLHANGDVQLDQTRTVGVEDSRLIEAITQQLIENEKQDEDRSEGDHLRPAG